MDVLDMRGVIGRKRAPVREQLPANRWLLVWFWIHLCLWSYT